jgi:PLP dependent protein
MNNGSPLIDNVQKVRDQIAAAAKRSGRPATAVKLVAVTKYVNADLAHQLAAAGCQDLGESRPQELWSKAEALAELTNATVSADPIRWHLIGHLQRNKVERTLPLVSLIHSGDSLRILEAIDRAVSAAQLRVPILIEVNISGDPTKHGFAPDEVEPNLSQITALSSLEFRGLMTMASREGDLDQARREFCALRQLRDKLALAAPPNIRLTELSMGMSGDFQIAIEEGATIVRVGSALFEGLI